MNYKKHLYKPHSLQLIPTNPLLASLHRHPPVHDKQQCWQCGLRHTFISKGLKMYHRKLPVLQETKESPLKSGRENDHCWAPSLKDVFIQRKMPCRDAPDSQGKPRFSLGALSTGSSWHLNQKLTALSMPQARTDCWACPPQGKSARESSRCLQEKGWMLSKG